LVVSQEVEKSMVSIADASRRRRDFAPDIGLARRAPPPQVSQKIGAGAIHELPLRVRRNDEAESRCRWTFYEVIFLDASRF
jgi:hypothetical protein